MNNINTLNEFESQKNQIFLSINKKTKNKASL